MPRGGFFKLYLFSTRGTFFDRKNFAARSLPAPSLVEYLHVGWLLVYHSLFLSSSYFTRKFIKIISVQTLKQIPASSLLAGKNVLKNATQGSNSILLILDLGSNNIFGEKELVEPESRIKF